jgi:hypothetical protein
MIATQIQQIFYGCEFKDQTDINYQEDIAVDFVAFLKECVDQGIIEDKRSSDWDPTTQIENSYLFSKDISKAREFQKKLLESSLYQRAYEAMRDQGYHLSVGMVNFVETDDTQYTTIK